jgi:hypothetical protein
MFAMAVYQIGSIHSIHGPASNRQPFGIPLPTAPPLRGRRFDETEAVPVQF